MNEAGREDFSICQENQTQGGVDVTDNRVEVHYKCAVCEREWYVIYKYQCTTDEHGHRMAGV
jgi:hypothetical protein